VVYLSPTAAGSTHDKKTPDEADLVYPVNSTLDKDTGFQGYEPAGILTQQPQKSREARCGAWRTSSSIIFSPVSALLWST
jgi:hypothetical protein